MAHKPKPRLERALVPVWDILSLEEKRALIDDGLLPRGYEPQIDRTPSRQQRLEGLAELGRIMRLPPGRLEQMKREMIDRVEPEEGK